MLPGANILHCEQCGARLPPGTDGLSCLHCLLRGGLEAGPNEAAVSPIDLGTRLYQHYEVLTQPDGSAWELGRGAMGVTYKARDLNLQVPVALKVLNSRLSVHPGARRRFLQEAQAAAQLRHPNVASVFHFGVVNALPITRSAVTASAPGDDEIESGDCFYAMELVEGETLEARLRRAGSLTPAEALEIAAQVAGALVAAEKHGLVHRDLKPANIMLLPRDVNGREGEVWVKVIDFGVAQLAAGNSGASNAGFLGTPEFCSPEQLHNGQVDARADIYALGATLWYALTGKPPRPQQPARKSQAAALPITPLTERGVPALLAELLQGMLAADPRDRPRSAVALAEALRKCREQLSERPAPIAARAPRRIRYAIAGAVAAAVAGLACWWWWSGAIPNDKSIAVLPFTNLGNDPRNIFLVDGIEGDLLSSLVKISDLKVISRLSASRFPANQPRDLLAIGRALGVRHVLEGRVGRDGDRVLVQLSLVDTRDQHVLWTERYDRTIADTISLQGQVATEIVDELNAELTPQERVEISAQPTRNPDAYLLYLRARKFENSPTFAISDFEAAFTLCTQALALDPQFALAHARLAAICGQLYRSLGPNEELKRRAHAELREALHLEPGLGEAHLAMGLCYYRIDRDFERALPELELAGRLLPNDPEPDAFIAYIKRRQGKWQEARRRLERVVTRDPQNVSYAEELFATACLLREWKSADEHVRHTRELAPMLPQVKIEQAYLAFWRKGDLGPVRKVFAEIHDYGDPEGNLAWARWDAAMIARDSPRAQAAIDGFPFETFPAVFSVPVSKAYLRGCIRLAQGDNAGAQTLFASARPAMEAEVRAHPNDALRHDHLGLLYAYMGRKADAIREGEQAASLQPAERDAYDGPERLCTLALIHARTGDPEKAIEMIESLLRRPGCVSFYEASMSLSDLRLRWEWDPLRADPRFQKILGGPEPTTLY